jgi:hypothetical protein
MALARYETIHAPALKAPLSGQAWRGEHCALEVKCFFILWHAALLSLVSNIR